ncbi:hypothetical protein [Saccharopolyspora sp. ASAGF58]|uniref:hypothetical protein n=1 Tax=Saccharopolyspora sp. ASAGF58 TaxID=2719023 RepID=UPI00144554E3|nr:hypothetical protein [Saccharopolyspora sp. ASAGF58]
MLVVSGAVYVNQVLCTVYLMRVWHGAKRSRHCRSGPAELVLALVLGAAASCAGFLAVGGYPEARMLAAADTLLVLASGVRCSTGLLSPGERDPGVPLT